MKILFCSSHLNYWEQISRTVAELEARGHGIEVLFDPALRGKFEPRLKGAGAGTLARPEEMIVRDDPLGKATAILRETVNYLSYYRPERRPFSKLLAERWCRFLPHWLWRLRYWKNACRLLSSAPIYAALRKAAVSAPLCPAIIADLQRRKPDAVVVLPLLLNASTEFEYLRTAKALGIPTGAIIPSWDNLTSKGIFHVLPDRVFVWNEAQREEAARIFGIPRARTVATGAPRYDRWFDLKPSRTEAETARMIGVREGEPYVLWLCSSVLIASEEQELIGRVSAELARGPGAARLVVRPHFQNLAGWKRWLASGGAGVHLWPRPEDLETFDVEDFHQNFFDALHYSRAAIGINTSAFLEAAIADKPCLTIFDKNFRETQKDIPHFRHLAEAGFLQCAADTPELVREVARAAGGEDPLAGPRRNFVEAFLRSRMGSSASRELANAITGLYYPRAISEPQTALTA